MAKVSTFTSDFTTIDPGIWTTGSSGTGFSATVDNGAAKLTYGTENAAACHITSITRYDLTDSSVHVKIADPGTKQTNWRAMLHIGLPVATSRATIYVSDQFGVTCQLMNSLTPVFSDGEAYVPATHVWLRIRHTSSGTPTIWYDRSADGITWTNMLSTPASGATFDLTDCQVRLEALRNSVQATSGYSSFDRLNLPTTATSSTFMPFFTLYSGYAGDSNLAPPTAPTCISAIAGAVTNSVVLNWDDSTYATGTSNRGYEVHEDLFSADNVVATVVDSTRTSGVLTAGNYRYYVVATDSNGTSSISPKLNVTVPVSTPVDAPIGCSGLGGGTPTAPIFVADFSTGNFQQWNTMNTPHWNQTSGGDKTTVGYPSTGNYSAEIVSDPVKGYAAKMELRGSGTLEANQPFKARAEVSATVATTGIGTSHGGDTVWYQQSFRFDATFPQNHASLGWGLIAQFHDGENNNYSPSIAWYIDQRDGYVSLVVTRQSAPNVYISQNSVYDAPLGTAWHNYKMRIVWSTSDAVGSIQLWKDNVRQNFLDGTNEIHTRTLHPTSDMVYYREGYYRNSAIQNITGIVYHAGYRCAAAETGLL